MSTDIGPLSDEFPPDPESELLYQVSPATEVPDSVLPVFDDLIEDPAIVATYDEYGNILEYEAESEPEPTPIGRTWAFDFDKGDFVTTNGGTPIKIENDDSRIIQQWIRRALTTERLSYLIYPADFGVELDPVISHSLTGPAATAQVAATVNDTLMYHDRIESVNNIVVTEQNGKIYVSAEVQISQGELVEVDVPVTEV